MDRKKQFDWNSKGYQVYEFSEQDAERLANEVHNYREYIASKMRKHRRGKH